MSKPHIIFYSGYTRGLAVKEGHARGYVKALQEALHELLTMGFVQDRSERKK